jgi:hypothetical protein
MTELLEQQGHKGQLEMTELLEQQGHKGQQEMTELLDQTQQIIGQKMEVMFIEVLGPWE